MMTAGRACSWSVRTATARRRVCCARDVLAPIFFRLFLRLAAGRVGVPADAWVPVCAEWCRKRLVAEPDAKVHISTVRDAFASSTALPAAHAGALREAFKRPKSKESKAFKKTLEAIAKGNIKNQVVIDGKNQVGILHFRLKGDHVADDDEEVLSDAGAAEPAAEEEEEEEEEE